MSDIEERLRKGFGPHDPTAADYPCLVEAADEIASLRAALRHMIDDADRNQRPGGGSSVPQWVRKALGETSNG